MTRDAELDRACALLLDIEGTILAYWTDIPEHVLEETRVEIRDFLGDWQPSALAELRGAVGSERPADHRFDDANP